MENSADVILVPSRLAGKVESIDCHVVTGHTYVSTTYILMHTHIHNTNISNFSRKA